MSQLPDPYEMTLESVSVGPHVAQLAEMAQASIGDQIVHAWRHPDGRVRTASEPMPEPWEAITEEEMRAEIEEARRAREQNNQSAAAARAARTILSRLAEVIGVSEVDLINEIRTALNE